MEDVTRSMGEYLFELTSLLLAAIALIYAARAFQVAKQALEAAKESDLAALKLKAHEGRARAERSFLSLQSACHDTRSRWDVHHDRYFPKLGARDYRQQDTRHILEVENEGRKLLTPLVLDLPELRTMDAAALEDYIQQADQSALKIERLTFRLSAPRQLFT